jgi:hypothetical protein
MFIPDDVRLRKFGAAIAEQRRHSLRKESQSEDTYDGERDTERPAKKTETERDLAEQLSLFAPISATPLDEHGRPLEEPRIYQTDGEADGGPNGEIPDFVGAGAVALTPRTTLLRPSPALGRVPPPVADPIPVAPPKSGALARRRQLREQNSEAVIDLVHLTGRTHADINAALNRKVGIKRIGMATVRQLEQRLAAAKAMSKRR